MRILVLDHDNSVVPLWHADLERAGHAVSHTSDVEVAVALLRSQTFELLILEILIDSEYNLTAAILAQFHNPDCQTVVISDSAQFMHGDLFSMLSSLRCILPRHVSSRDLMAVVGDIEQGRQDVFDAAWMAAHPDAKQPRAPKAIERKLRNRVGLAKLVGAKLVGLSRD